MNISPTLSWYLARQFLAGIVFVLVVLMALVFLFDLIEHLRRASGHEAATLGVVLQLSLLQLPELGQKVVPFAALFGALHTFTRLTRSHELIVARAAGVSVWQFLMPPVLIAFLIGVFVVTVFNPFAAVMISRYEQLEGHFLEGRTSLLAVSSTGLWLRQGDARSQSVIHARHVSAAGTDLRDVIVFLYGDTDEFTGRIDAKAAHLRRGYWELDDALLTRPQQPSEHHETYKLPTTLTLEQIQESFASPETLSFWALPRFIRTLEQAGFSAQRHRLYWNAIMATPLLLCAMVLLAATFSLRLTRRGHTGLLLAAGVCTAFVLYFISDVVYALGVAGNLPVALAAWTPAGVSTLLGVASLLHLEDG
ncbi:MAG TPA: LPS export ABC transporter permease LptG [Alphaproteobacteria bacterium]|nr:LPS export ABC transporter permease LptG [Alphaproteobacteria bacterium]